MDPVLLMLIMDILFSSCEFIGFIFKIILSPWLKVFDFYVVVYVPLVYYTNSFNLILISTFVQLPCANLFKCYLCDKGI